MGRFNVAPTQEILTVRSSPDPEEAAQGEREARLMRWGLVPRWAKDLKVGYKMINAKTERLLESRAYSPLVGKFRHRCLIVADGFYEWMKAEDPKQPRQPVALHGRRRRAVRLRRDLHPQGVGGGGGRRGGLALQRHDHHDDAERARRPGPQPDAGDPRRAGGRGRLAQPRARAPRTLSRCAARSTPGGWTAQPANPKMNKVGKGIEGPELLVAPA